MATNEELEARLEAIEIELARYKGFIGGVIFVVSAIFTVIMFFKDWVWQWMHLQ